MDAQRLMAWLDHAATFSTGNVGVTRQFLTAEHRRLVGWLGELADALDFEHWLDASGNYRMRRKAADPAAPTLLLGSHQDTVSEGGRYDGMLGVLLPLAVAESLPELPFHMEVIAFGDEEGARFSSTLIGSSALAGHFDHEMLGRTDDAGITMLDAMHDFGLQPQRIDELALDPAALLGFVEVHIEQGPLLESRGLPVGVVNAITGIERHQVVVAGQAGHAGTTPMELRDDALVKAARIVTLVDELCQTTPEVVGVVGKLAVEPNAVNVIPGRVTLTVELRSPDESRRREGWRMLAARLDAMTGVTHIRVYEQAGIVCEPELTARLERAVTDEGLEPLTLFSGAGHDGLAMAHVAPCAMLFVRCRAGLSHHPDESITVEDCAVAMRVLRRFLLNMSGHAAGKD